VTGLLKRFFAPRREPVQELNHPTLGTLVYDRESPNWGKTVTLSGRPFRLSVVGDHEPDPSLLGKASKSGGRRIRACSGPSGFPCACGHRDA
jgi:hypothetical protein